MPKRSRGKSSTQNASTALPESESGPDNKKNTVEEPLVVESLVAGRAKRSTAGNRLAHLLDREAASVDADDELELLFQEAEDDVEFEAAEDEGDLSDVQLESSDEEEEGGGDGEGNDELTGEAELQAELRAERAKKRKAPETSFKPPRQPMVTKKKVTIVEVGNSDAIQTGGHLTPSEEALNKQRKKSERISWIPTDGPTRSSSRKLSLHNKALTHQRLKESEARRLHTIALMEAAAKKKEKENPKREMTQAERLEEAKKTEEMNRKSLNKWQESEAIRAEQQRAKLAALHNRNLQGAVIRWYSGRAEWDERGKLVKVGKGEKLVQEIDDREKEKKGRAKAKAVKSEVESPPKDSSQSTEDEVEGPKSGPASSSSSETPMNGTRSPPQHLIPRQMPSITDLTSDQPQSQHPPPSPLSTQPQQLQLPPTFSTNSKVPPPLLDGILFYASLPNGTTKPATIQTPLKPPPAPEQPQYSTRNLVILQNFEPSQVQHRDTLARTIFPHTTSVTRREKPPQAVCYMTSELAKFRDPQTNIPYANLWAYKQIQRIRSGQIRWSSLLEAYVGPTDEAAKGVPEGFLY